MYAREANDILAALGSNEDPIMLGGKDTTMSEVDARDPDFNLAAVRFKYAAADPKKPGRIKIVRGTIGGMIRDRRKLYGQVPREHRPICPTCGRLMAA